MPGLLRPSPHPLLVHGTLVLVSLIFGLNYVAVKIIVEAVPRQSWMFWRIAVATAFLLPIALWNRKLPRDPKIWLALLLAAALGVIANQIMFAEGMARTMPGHGAVINALIPVLTLVFAIFAGQEHLDAKKALALLCATSGVLVLLHADEMFQGAMPVGSTLLGDLLVLGNAATFSAFLVIMRKIGNAVDPLVASAIGFCYGVFAIGGYSLAHDAITAASFVQLFTQPVLPWTLFAILGATVLTYLMNAWALRHTHSSQVAFYICIQPLVASVVSPQMTGEQLGLRFWIAVGLVCLAVVVQSWPRRSG